MRNKVLPQSHHPEKWKKTADSFLFYLTINKLRVQNTIQEWIWGCLAGHPYIASLWLESLTLIRSRQKLGILFWLCSVVTKLNRICAITKGVLFFTHPFLGLKGSMLYKALLSCISWIHSNNCKHVYGITPSRFIHTVWLNLKIFNNFNLLNSDQIRVEFLSCLFTWKLKI